MSSQNSAFRIFLKWQASYWTYCWTEPFSLISWSYALPCAHYRLNGAEDSAPRICICVLREKSVIPQIAANDR